VTAGARAWQANDSTKKPDRFGLPPFGQFKQPQFRPVDADADVAQGDRVAVDADPKPSLQRAPRPQSLEDFPDTPRQQRRLVDA